MRLPVFLLAALLTALTIPTADAQRAPIDPRFGVGFDLIGGFPGQNLVPSGLGVGVRGRVSIPFNADVSFAADAGLAGFVLGGRESATYLFNPQVSAIITLPRGRTAARYLLGGVGGYLPLGTSGAASGGPALHAGLGWAFPLQETSVYVEVNPALVIGGSESTVVLPVRAGIIF
ncbi:hypothetical protein BH23BAC4_BH23BAC4_11190 [soil metagenome]